MNKRNVISISLLKNNKSIFDLNFRYPEEADKALRLARTLIERGCKVRIQMRGGNQQVFSDRNKSDKLELQFNPVMDENFGEPVSGCTYMKSDYSDAASYIKWLIANGNPVIMDQP